MHVNKGDLKERPSPLIVHDSKNKKPDWRPKLVVKNKKPDWRLKHMIVEIKSQIGDLNI